MGDFFIAKLAEGPPKCFGRETPADEALSIVYCGPQKIWLIVANCQCSYEQPLVHVPFGVMGMTRAVLNELSGQPCPTQTFGLNRRENAFSFAVNPHAQKDSLRPFVGGE